MSTILKPKQPKQPKAQKEPKKMKPSTYLNRFELLMNSYHAPLLTTLTPESIFFSASKSYAYYDGDYEKFLADNNNSKFNLYRP